MKNRSHYWRRGITKTNFSEIRDEIATPCIEMARQEFYKNAEKILNDFPFNKKEILERFSKYDFRFALKKRK